MQVVAVSPTATTLEGWLPDQATLKEVLDTLYELRFCLDKVTRLHVSGVHAKGTLSQA